MDDAAPIPVRTHHERLAPLRRYHHVLTSEYLKRCLTLTFCQKLSYPLETQNPDLLGNQLSGFVSWRPQAPSLFVQTN